MPDAAESTGHPPQRRLGVLIPSSNTVVESELARALPHNVSLHSARLPHLGRVEPDAVGAMCDNIERAALMLASAAVDLIVVFAAVPTLLRGDRSDREIALLVSEVTGTPSTTTSSAMIAALRELKVRRLALGTPFVPSINEKVVAFLRAHDFEVLADRGLAIQANVDIGRLSPESARRMAIEIDQPQADAVLLACTNWQTLEAIDAAEQAIGKPVITTTQASLWQVSRLLGVPVRAYGRLMRGDATS